MTPTRPVLRWHGGKWLLAPWIISHFPSHDVYVEPFGGAGSVLMRKARSYAEVWNDLDGDVVNLFRVLRSSDANRLVAHLRLTPFARDGFDEAYGETEDPVEQARRLVIRSFHGFGSDGHNGARPTGFRANSNRSGTTPAHDWINYPDNLTAVIERLAGVVIENRPAMQVMAAHDGPETLHYLDPPYVHSTRSTAHNSTRKNYRHEMTDEDHTKLLDFVQDLEGKCIISGYAHPIYETALADGARERTEVLWINPACVEALRQEHDNGPLFAEVASA